MLFYGGDGAGLVSVNTQCVALTSRIRTAPTKHEVLVLYRVYNVEGVSIPYNRTGVALYKVTLKGLVDTARDAGDRLFQWFREKQAVLATGAIAGNPGTWYPTGSGVPGNLGAMGPVQPVTALGVPALGTWTTGQHMVLGDASTCNWNGTAWVTGIHAATAGEGREGGRTNGKTEPPTQPGQPDVKK